MSNTPGKATGPKTPEGKARSSQNAVKHGLCARTPVIISPHLKESRAAYNSLRAALSAKLTPNSPLEQFLTLRLADCAWLLGRVEKIPEIQFPDFTDGLSDPQERELLEMAGRQYKLLLYKRRLYRRMERTHRMLKSVKRNQTPIVVQQLEQALAEKNNRCETNSPLPRVL